MGQQLRECIVFAFSRSSTKAGIENQILDFTGFLGLTGMAGIVFITFAGYITTNQELVEKT